MGDPTRRRCRLCGKHDKETGSISWTGLCSACAKERYEGNLLELVAHEGDWFQHWRRGMAASVGGVILDADRDDT